MQHILNSKRVLIFNPAPALAWPLLLGLCCSQALAQSEFILHENRWQGWSISYPRDWRQKEDGAGNAQFISASGDAVCGVHVANSPPASVYTLTDRVLSGQASFLKEHSRIESIVVSRKKISLTSGEPATDVVVDLMPGGRSRRIFSIADSGRAYMIDCETYVPLWQTYQDIFDKMILSFRIGARS
jgi:hypothetical protein